MNLSSSAATNRALRVAWCLTVALIAGSVLSVVETRAQGSAGGSIGKQGKSASGESEEAKPTPPARVPARRRAANTETRDADTSCRGLAGKWSWSTGGETVIRSSGTLSKGELTGKWTCKSGEVVILWSHGYTDRLTLSGEDGRLSGKNQLGFTITGRRKGAE